MAHAPKLHGAGKLQSPRPRETPNSIGLPDRITRWDHRSVGPRRGGSSSSRGRIPENRRRPERGGHRSNGRNSATRPIRSDPASAVEWELQFADHTDYRGGGCPPGLRRGRPWWWPKRRCGNPPSLFAITPTASGSRVRLSVFEENRSQPRCTGSHPERMKPHHWLLLERTPLMLRAHFGSSRVREDLPRHVRERGRSWPSLRDSFARPHRHQPCTQVTRPVMRSTEARPRFSSSRDQQRTTPTYSSNRKRSIVFSPGAHDCSNTGTLGQVGESLGFAWRR
jgi:hypothetical protein